MRFRPYQLLLIFNCIACSLSVAQFAKGDIFQLKSGGQVTGVLIERGKQGEYVVQSDRGAVVTLTRRQVKKVVPQKKKDVLYTKRSRSLPDTVEAHRELATWCKENKLTKHTKHHQQRIVELDPNDEEARLSLGYQQHHGRWMTRDEIMTARGLRKYGSDYRTPQDIALRERIKKRELSEVEWFRNIRSWVGWLGGRKAAEAAQLIRDVKDPLAANGIVKLLKREQNQRVRDLLTATLAELKHPLAVTTLVDFSLDEPDREVRLQCLEFLLQYHRPVRLAPYVQALKDPNNEIVNRAAEALHRLENPEAISPLIDALVTTHKYKNANAPVGNTSASFSPNGSPGGGGTGGGGGLSMGGNKSKVIQLNQKNLKVRQALVELSGGQDYDFDEKRWRMWFVNEQIEDYVDARRDE